MFGRVFVQIVGPPRKKRYDVLRKFYRPKSAINVITYMTLRQKKSRETTCPATEMWTSRTLRHHLKPPVHPANTNVLTSIMERKQVQETPAQQTADRGQ